MCVLMQMPKLAGRMEEEGVLPTMYCSQWFLTLYAYTLPIDHLLRVWDVSLRGGPKVFFGGASSSFFLGGGVWGGGGCLIDRARGEAKSSQSLHFCMKQRSAHQYQPCVCAVLPYNRQDVAGPAQLP